jgi:hypothetical protein
VLGINGGNSELKIMNQADDQEIFLDSSRMGSRRPCTLARLRCIVIGKFSLWVGSLNVRSKVIASLIVLIVGVPVTFVTWLVWLKCRPNPGVHKFVMPGDYKVHLSPGEYGGWIFTLWPSKHIKASPSAAIAISILDPDGRLVAQQPGIGLWFSDNLRRGRVEFHFRAEKDGTYAVSSREAERLVFVIVGQAQEDMDLGDSPCFEGEYGDFNF